MIYIYLDEIIFVRINKRQMVPSILCNDLACRYSNRHGCGDDCKEHILVIINTELKSAVSSARENRGFFSRTNWVTRVNPSFESYFTENRHTRLQFR